MCRLSVWSVASTIATLLFSLPVRGQFQEPTKEELQMTDDAKAPGSGAVYLTLEDDQDDVRKTHTYFERIKVLTEKGKEKATVRFTHDPNTKFEVEGRTIHKDGSVVPMTAPPSDLVEYKTKGMQLNTLVFTLPSVEEGCILEYRVKFKSSDSGYPTWMIQQEIFVHKAHYSYQTSNFGAPWLTYVSRLPAGANVLRKNGLYTLDLNDVAALPDEDWMPPLNAYKWRVSFFYSRFRSFNEYWDAVGSVWAEFVKKFTEPTGTLKKAVADVISPSDSDSVKAEKIYAAVMKLENTDFTRQKTKAERKKEKIKDIHNAQDVWRERSGNGDEIALLYVALCRAAGLNVVPMQVVDRSRAVFDQGLLNSGQLDDVIAVAKLDGKEIYLDPGQKMCRFGLLHWKHALSTGLRLGDKSATIERTPEPSYKTANLMRTADLRIDQTGSLRGEVRYLLQGQEALYWRQIALQDDEDEAKKKFNEWMGKNLPEGVEGEFDHFLALDDYNANLVAIAKVKGTLGAATGKHFFLPEQFFESNSRHPFVTQELRTLPVDVHYPRTEQDDVTYDLPAGYSLEVNPKASSISWPEHAQLTVSVKPSTGNVEVFRTLTYNYTVLSATEYRSLHDFYQKLAAEDHQQITLVRSASAPGN